VKGPHQVEDSSAAHGHDIARVPEHASPTDGAVIMTGVMLTDPSYVDSVWSRSASALERFAGRLEQIVNPSLPVAWARPTSSLRRWAANDYSTVVSRVDILRAVRHGEPGSPGGFVRIGGERLLRIYGWAQVDRVLQAIDAIRRWESIRRGPRHCGHNNGCRRRGQARYTRERADWLKRQRITLTASLCQSRPVSVAIGRPSVHPTPAEAELDCIGSARSGSTW